MPRLSKAVSIIQLVMGFINSAVVWMIILGVKNGELNIFNYFAFLNMVFGRQLVISSKNGFFRSNNWKIF
jgi:hypothetical protein